MLTTATPVPRHAAAATNQMIQTRTFPITWRRTESARADSVRARSLKAAALRPRCGRSCTERASSAPRLERRLGRVEASRIGDRHALDRLGEEHVLRVDEVVARVLGDLELVAERDRIERAGELAVAAEDAAAHVDLVDPRVALAGRDAVVGRVLRGDDADAVGRAGGRAERAADALLEPVLVEVQPVPAAEARVER